MWPFKKKKKQNLQENPMQFNYTQLDITEGFGDNLKLGINDWVDTIALNSEGSTNSGLPALDANADEIYAIADKMSRIRESFKLEDDGVYCPVCHIANIDKSKLRTPCPKCNRPLLQFGWD